MQINITQLNNSMKSATWKNEKKIWHHLTIFFSSSIYIKKKKKKKLIINYFSSKKKLDFNTTTKNRLDNFYW